MATRIVSLPSRYPELGRIRLGSKGPKGEPRKGKFLRFSSDDRLVLDSLASRLGGEVKPWADDKAEQAWHLTTESASVPILLPPDPIDTTYEKWGSGGIAKRCDGERCIMPVQSPSGGHMVESDCACMAEGLIPGDRDDQKKGACQVTVRLRLIIPSVPGLGAWLCTSHSIYAAMELPGQVELLQAMSGHGRLVPADFAIEPRTEKKPWEKYKRDYIVPVLRVRASLLQLSSGEKVAGELAAPSTEAHIDCPVGCGERGTREDVRSHLVDRHGWERNAAGGVVPPAALAPGAPAPGTDEGVRAGAVLPSSEPRPPGDTSGAAASPAAGPASPSQQSTGKLFALIAERGIVDRHVWAGEVLGRSVDTFAALTQRDVNTLIKAAEAAPVAPTLEGMPS